MHHDAASFTAPNMAKLPAPRAASFASQRQTEIIAAEMVRKAVRITQT